VPVDADWDFADYVNPTMGSREQFSAISTNQNWGKCDLPATVAVRGHLLDNRPVNFGLGYRHRKIQAISRRIREGT